MKNIKLFILAGLAICSGLYAEQDSKKLEPASFHDLAPFHLHVLAKNCPMIDFKKALELLSTESTANGGLNHNPFVQDDNGKTPRNITGDQMYKFSYGSLEQENCYSLYTVFRMMEATYKSGYVVGCRNGAEENNQK